MVDQRVEAVKKWASCAWQIHEHIVFPVKYRKALLDEEVAGIIQETAAEIADRFPTKMEAIGTDENHIHVRCSVHPKRAAGRIVQIFKRITAREIFRRKPAVKRVLWGEEFYIRGRESLLIAACMTRPLLQYASIHDLTNRSRSSCVGTRQVAALPIH